MSSAETQQHILQMARQCFFRHGYKASNMSMVSEYAGFSRATLHKHFKNKDILFRAVCQQYQEQGNRACRPLLTMPASEAGDTWQKIETVLGIWLRPSFEEVSDQMILRDLKFHAQTVAEDIFNAAHEDLCDMISQLVAQGVENGELNLDAMTGINHTILSQLIVAALDGFRGHYETEEVVTGLSQLLTVFKQACKTD